MLNKININSKGKILIVYIAITLVTLAVFWQVNQHTFINLDDDGYIIENSHIRSGFTLDEFRWAFSNTNYAYFWHPLTWLSFMFDYQFYGLNAGGYHLTNLILHILSALLLFWLFNRMTGEIWKSAFVAALFALHPLHVESVAWVSARKDVLSAFFWMLTLCLYVYYTEKPAIRRYLLVLFSFVLALMSKPMVVTLPFIMILLDYWPLKRFESKKDNLILWQLKEKIPFFISSAVISIITIYAQYNPSEKTFSLASRLANAPVSFVTYLAKTFWPHDMTVFYYFPAQIPLWQVSGASLLIIIISATVILTLRRLPYLFAGWMWFAITISPVIGIIQINKQAMGDRYTYLPLIGIFVMLSWGIPSLVQSENIRKKILFPAAIAALSVLSVLAWIQCGHWKNGIELFSHSISVTKNNYLAHCRRGINYGESGQYQLAIEDFNKAIDLKNNYYDAYNNRGTTYARIGQYQNAIEDYKEVIRLKPDYANAYNNRAIVHLSQGNKELGCYDAKKACELGNCEILKVAELQGYCR